MSLGHQVHLVQSDAVLDEFEIVPIDATRVGDALAKTQPSFHVGDALGADAPYGVSLVGADPVVIAPGQALKQTVEVVPNDGGIGPVDPSIGVHVAGGPIVKDVEFKEREVVFKEVFKRISTAIHVQSLLPPFSGEDNAWRIFKGGQDG